MYCQNCKTKMIRVLYVVRKKRCLHAYYCTTCGELIHLKGTYAYKIWRGRYLKRIGCRY